MLRIVPPALLFTIFSLACGLHSILPEQSRDAANQSPVEPVTEIHNKYSIVPQDYRVILQPGEWKIRDRTREAIQIEYKFSLGLKWSELELNYPHCYQVACLGLAKSEQKDCGQVCFTDMWHERTGLLQTATYAYNRAVESLKGTFEDLAAVMETHIPNPIFVKHIPERRVKDSLWEHRTLDVMKYHRQLIEDIVENITTDSQHSRMILSHSKPGAKASVIQLLDTWKSGALNLAIQLDTLTHVLQEARLQLLMCVHAVQKSDVTYCQPGFISEFYTDTPVSIHWQSTDSLVLIAKREKWKRLTLSFWYMSFIDSSRGDRICWLDRPMLNDTHSNYRVPECDSRGLCEPLEPDNRILRDCEVNEYGETGLECTVVCEGSCFGPICFDSESESYIPRNIYPYQQKSQILMNDRFLFLVTNKPRILSTVHSLSQADLHATYSRMLSRANEASHLLQQGESVLNDLMRIKSGAQKYMEEVTKKNEVNHEYEGEQRKVRYIAGASLTLSILTCPMLLILIIKVLRRTNNRGGQSAAMRPNRYTNILRND